LVARLGRTAEQGLVSPSDRLRPAIEPLIALREALRKENAYAAADVIRDALAAAGVELKDTPDGPRWDVNAGQ
jgi:cysteinyl-tRNA synthetase